METPSRGIPKSQLLALTQVNACYRRSSAKAQQKVESEDDVPTACTSHKPPTGDEQWAGRAKAIGVATSSERTRWC